MKYKALLFLMMPLFGWSQNLIPNNSFEDTLFCPDGYDQMVATEFWSSFTGTCDYYNSCDESGYVGVPNNWTGSQDAVTGEAYAGITHVSLTNSDYHEHLGVSLIEPLVVGETYYVSFYAIRAPRWSLQMASNNQGALFTTTPMEFYSSGTPLPNFAHVVNEEIITDTVAWHQVKSSFVADSAYQYMMIGNFFNDLNTDSLILGEIPSEAYYFIDEVRVSTDSAYVCEFVGIADLVQQEMSIYPNPCNTFFEVISQTPIRSCRVFSQFGRLMTEFDSASGNSLKIDTSSFPNGLYFIHLHFINGNSSSHRLIKLE